MPKGSPLAIELLARPQGTEDLARLLPELDPEWIDWLVDRLTACRTDGSFPGGARGDLASWAPGPSLTRCGLPEPARD